MLLTSIPAPPLPLILYDYSQRLEDGSVRIAFLFIVHTDAEFVTRLLDRLYSEKHYYLVHIDPFASKGNLKYAVLQ